MEPNSLAWKNVGSTAYNKNMTKEEQLEMYDNITESMKLVMEDKGDDYSNEDRLSNFKTVAAIVGIAPAQICLVMMGIKVARLGVLLKSKLPPTNESILDSAADLTIYGVLLQMILNEK